MYGFVWTRRYIPFNIDYGATAGVIYRIRSFSNVFRSSSSS